MPGVEGCWFCDRAAADRHVYRVALHRNVEVSSVLVVGTRTEWERADLRVPRCGRCRAGHVVESLLLVGGVPALAWASALLIDGLTQAPGRPPLNGSTVAQIVAFSLPFAAWLAVVLGAPGVRRWFPHRRRHVRRHPSVAALLDDGWRYGGAPIYQFDRRWPGLE